MYYKLDAEAWKVRQWQRSLDSFPVVASVIAVATKPGNPLSALRRLHKASPGRLHALKNEVVDIKLVLNKVAVVIRESEGLPT